MVLCVKFKSMKKLCLVFIAVISLLIFTNCNKKCTDTNAVNFDREGECLYCSSTFETEIITFPVTNVITYSMLYGQEIAEATLERKYTAFVGKGCGLDYPWRQTPSCEINIKIKNISNKNFKQYYFLIEYSLNDIYEKEIIYSSNPLSPNQETDFIFLTNKICGNLKNAKITITATYLNF